MAIFYTDSGSFNDIEVTGSLRVSGSLSLTSAQNFNITGSLLGTASNAINSDTASYFAGYITFPAGLDVTGSTVLNGVTTILGNTTITGSLFVSSASRFTAPVTASAFSGPLTGSLNVVSGSVRLVTSSLVLESSAGNTATHTAESVYLVNTSGITQTWRVNNSSVLGITYTGASFQPETTNQVPLGASNGRWSTLWTVHVSASGNITASSAEIASITGSLLGTSSWAQSSSVSTTASFVLPSGLPIGTVSSSLQINTGSFSGSFFGTTASVLLVEPPTDNTGAVGTAGKTWANGQFTNLTVDTALTVNDNIQLSANDQLRMGSATSFVLSHDGTNNFISSNESNLQFRDSTTPRITLFRTTGDISASGAVTASGFFGTSSWARNAISSSFATTASAATSITFTPSTASFAISASYAPGSPSVSASYAETASFAVSASWAPGGSGTTINNNVDNYLVTATGTANTINGEVGLTYDGSLLSVTGNVSASIFSGSLDRFNPPSLRLTVGTTAPSTPVTNDLWVDTN